MEVEDTTDSRDLAATLHRLDKLLTRSLHDVNDQTVWSAQIHERKSIIT